MKLTEFGSTGRHYLVFKDQNRQKFTGALTALEAAEKQF